jgi:hypothetical protein
MNDCLEWPGSRNERGYGRVHVGDRLQYVHRVEWAKHYGPIPEGMKVCHRCDNPPCYRIEHLFLGTQADNLADMHAKGRHPGNGFAAKTHCMHGHPLSGKNLYLRPSGGRLCRQCNGDSCRRSRARQRLLKE